MAVGERKRQKEFSRLLKTKRREGEKRGKGESGRSKEKLFFNRMVGAKEHFYIFIKLTFMTTTET